MTVIYILPPLLPEFEPETIRSLMRVSMIVFSFKGSILCQAQTGRHTQRERHRHRERQRQRRDDRETDRDRQRGGGRGGEEGIGTVQKPSENSPKTKDGDGAGGRDKQ